MFKATLQGHSETQEKSRSHFKVTLKVKVARQLKVTLQGHISRLAPKVSSQGRLAPDVGVLFYISRSFTPTRSNPLKAESARGHICSRSPIKLTRELKVTFQCHTSRSLENSRSRFKVTLQCHISRFTPEVGAQGRPRSYKPYLLTCHSEFP
ncbi:unnamed protein product [Acanthoscelides obtectus]|uniref:Uncharacterized protein n=1 Tax=Acanthoscelides obtectus TaxID=200917 RepID=A0A9P0PDM2_ACAOB|nr:unnamed protein product [Acanthoscelides obtectus]CAK1665310.1 hypothetical protein AOBTE_LOCUS24754 [Acanthoscelides obtectus]